MERAGRANRLCLFHFKRLMIMCCTVVLKGGFEKTTLQKKILWRV